MTLRLPRWTVAAAATVSAAIILAGVVVPSLLHGDSGADVERIQRAVAFEGPHSFAVWWASTLFLLVAALAYTEGTRPWAYGGAARRLEVIAAVLAWLAVDHGVHIHIAVARLASHVGVPQGADPEGLVLGTVVVVAGLPLLRPANPTRRLLLVAAALLFAVGGWGVDAVVALFGQEPSLVSEAVESGSEWAGLVLLASLFADGRTWGPTSIDRQPAHDPRLGENLQTGSSREDRGGSRAARDG